MGTGLHAGVHTQRVLGEFEDIVNELLSEPMVHNMRGSGPSCLGECFSRVFYVKLA